MSDRSRRLKYARIEAGYPSARNAAMENDWPTSSYGSRENGNKPLLEPEARVYSETFGVDLIWLMHGVGTSERSGVPLIGAVGGGGRMSLAKQADIKFVDAPLAGPAGLEAAIVESGAMRPSYNDGDTLYFDDHGNDLVNLIGQDCVLWLSDGTAWVRIPQHGSDKDLYDLISINAEPLRDQRIVRASKIRWVFKR